MRRLELLINDIRFNADQINTSRYPSQRLMKFFSDAQRELQSLIVSNDAANKWFIKAKIQDLSYGVEEYALPDDIFALSYVLDVKRAYNQGADIVYYPLIKISDKELRRASGYSLAGNSFFISPLPTINLASGIQIKYVKQLATLSLRWGVISSFTSGVSIQLGAGYLTTQMTDYDDFVTVVDKDGVIKQSGIRVTGYNTGTGLVSTSDTLTGIAAGDYVVVGKLATSHSELPDVCEGVLTSMVERAIQRTDASQEFTWASLVTQEQKAAILAVVAGAQHDVMYPPITDEDYLNL